MMNLFIKKSISTCISSATSQRVGRVKILICMPTNHQKRWMSFSMPEIRRAERADSVASILAIRTANPDNIVFQAEYPDFYFRVNNCEHMIDLKDKFKRICQKSGIRKRHMHLTEDLLKENPHMCDYNASSLDTRQDILTIEVPKLGEVAATKAIKEWGQSKDKITHLIFCTMAGVDMPGADYQLTKLLDLNPTVNRFMLYHQGCYAGGTALRLAKDIAENNRGARVLVVCCEMTVVNFRGPTETHMSSMVSQALFGDRAGAVIVGSDLDESKERPMFDIVRASQTMLANSDGAIEGHLRQAGLHINLHKDVPKLISKNINKTLVDVLGRPNNKIIEWNSMFWLVHPGGPAILDELERELGLEQDRLAASRHVLSEFGNMSSACVLFILDEMRRRSIKEGKATTGEGFKCGFLLGFGPGVTVEAVVLRSCPT